VLAPLAQLALQDRLLEAQPLSIAMEDGRAQLQRVRRTLIDRFLGDAMARVIDWNQGECQGMGWDGPHPVDWIGSGLARAPPFLFPESKTSRGTLRFLAVGSALEKPSVASCLDRRGLTGPPCRTCQAEEGLRHERRRTEALLEEKAGLAALVEHLRLAPSPGVRSLPPRGLAVGEEGGWL
jgi:hypothetical protein